MILRDIIEGPWFLKNEYKGAHELASTETAIDFLKRVFWDYYDRPIYINENKRIMLSMYEGDGEIDGIHDEERGDFFYETYIKVE